jgi:hypothetical protein
MFWLGAILLILWLIGTATAHTFGGFVHVLLVAALIMFVLRIIRGT